jgi:flagella basal body P-ring formation protein FlgA
MHRIAAILALLALVAPARADSITLRRTVTVEPGRPVLLRDIADLEGPAAVALAETPIADDTRLLPRDGQASRLDLATIRERLESLPGVNWAFLSLRGAGVLLSEPGPAPSAPPDLTRSIDDSPPIPADTEPRAIVPGTIRALAHDLLLKVLRVTPENLRVDWPARHDEFLDEPVDGRLIHVQPLGRSARLPLSITIYEGDRIVRTETVRADLAVRHEAFVVAKAVPRGATLTDAELTPRDLWLDPRVTPATTPIGQVTTRRLEPGSVVQTDDIEAPLAVRRGEFVQVHCVAGAVVLKTRGRALESGRDGEVIRVEMTGSGEKIMARLNGPGRAVLVVPSAGEGPHGREEGS